MSTKPTYQIRIQAIVLAPQGQSDPLKVSNGTTFGAAEIKQAIDKANTIYTQAGIHFNFDPAEDLEGESSALSLDNNPDAKPVRIVVHSIRARQLFTSEKAMAAIQVRALMLW
jgi:hypothetical protein